MKLKTDFMMAEGTALGVWEGGLNACKCKTNYGTNLEQVCEMFSIFLEPAKDTVMGKNYFSFWITKNNCIRPAGSKGTTVYSFPAACKISKSNSSNGYGCAAWVI